jgi:Protein kinase domain/AAA ATPase domain
MANLRHPRIVEVFDYGVADDVPYYTLELLDGKDLHDLGKVPWKRACEILRDVASALAFLHARRLLHRDLAPRNVRCTSDGRAKLIDFGVLATAGITGDVAGTPPYMAPETVHGRPLDHRYDLYGLGALAYHVLTGRHAYPARSIEQLETAWRNKPAPPSELEAGIPAALDELVMSLLAHDPLARPTGAAEVIDRLGAIAELPPPEREAETTHGWLASAALVGRQREVQQIKRAVARAFEGDGRSLLVEAPSGTGKSRLLREVALEAQLAGLCVVRAESDAAGRGPYGIFNELARGLVAAMPDVADAAARPRGAMLARAVDCLRERYQPAKPLGDPAEDRMQLLQELAAWVLEIANDRPIALLVDDVQRCDEASAAVLASLAHGAARHKLIVAAALRTDEPARAPAAIAALIDAGQRLRLRGLDEPQLGELCRSLFGDVPHVARLAHWMHQVAGGSPLHTTELARDLVDRGVIRYVDGLWSIPEDPGREPLPNSLAEAMDARVRSLPAEARALGEALSVHGGDLGLDVIVAIADSRDTDAVFAALDKLAFEEVVISSGDSWRFRHDGLREALLRGIDPERRRALHLRIGETLTGDRDAEIGWHLLEGGDTERGAQRLERAGRALYAAQSFADCIAPLEAALGVLATRSARIRLELLHMLLMAGCMADRKAALRHTDACVQGYRYWSGVDVATRARRVVGRHLGVLLGLAWATLRWIFTPRRGPNPYEAFRTFFIVVGYSATIHSLGFDFGKTQQLIDLVEPVAMFRNRVPWAVYLLTCNTVYFPRGDIAIARRNCERILEILERDRITPIRDIDRKTGGGGARFMLALIDVMNLEPTLDAQLAKLHELGLKFFDIGAQQARIIYHRLRGEEEIASTLESKLELQFVQLGSIWQMEAFMPVIGSLGYAFARDTIGLRRTIEELAEMCAEGLRYEPFLDLARGEYLRERGDAKGALAKLEPLVAILEYPMLQIPVFAALAESQLVLGEHARAKELAEKGLAIASAPETLNLHGLLRCTRTLALAEAALGSHRAASQRLDEAIVRAKAFDSPMLLGSLHEARARVAFAAGNHAAFQEHLADTDYQFRRTRNPALIARVQRLAETGVRQRAATEIDDAARMRRELEVSVVSQEALTTQPPQSWVSAVLSGCRGSSERATRVLELVIGETRGTAGYLYLRHHGQLVLAAPTWGDEPPTELGKALARAVASPDEAATVAEVRRGSADKLDWKPVPLVLRLGDDMQFVVGGVAVIGGALPLVDPDPKLLEEIARELFEAGDVTHTRTVG